MSWFYFVSTPTVIKNDLPTAQMIWPFATKAEADHAAELLESRYDGQPCMVGSVDLDDAQLDPELIELRMRQARGDLAALLAGIPVR